MIINLTQHNASAEQLCAGVVNVTNKKELSELLTFDNIPSLSEIQQRATAIASIAYSSGYRRAMIGGAPFLMQPLVIALQQYGVESLFAFSRRESFEETHTDGSVRKMAVFRHVGFIPADCEPRDSVVAHVNSAMAEFYYEHGFKSDVLL